MFSKAVATLSPFWRPSLASLRRVVLSRDHISESFARDLRKARPSDSVPRIPLLRISCISSGKDLPKW